jgi:hypothetical protein
MGRAESTLDNREARLRAALESRGVDVGDLYSGGATVEIGQYLVGCSRSPFGRNAIVAWVRGGTEGMRAIRPVATLNALAAIPAGRGSRTAAIQALRFGDLR